MFRLFYAFMIVCGLAFAAQSAEIGDDGLHKQDWFEITFKDIAEDIETAKEQGKRLALIFEQRGCIYCKEVHEKLLVDPEIKSYLQENFMIVQYNLYGDEEVVDLDGEELTEKLAAKKWGFLFTPTFVFLPEEVPEGKNAKEAAVGIMPGSFRKGTFLDFFTWVNEKGYETEEGFQAYHARMIRERRAAGKQNTD